MSAVAQPPADPRPTAVLVEDLTFDYPGRRALDGLSFRIHQGEIFGFLGPNGGGKTTLFRILATLLEPGGGEVAIFGDPLPSEAALVRLQLGVVFQSPSLDAQLTVRENLIYHGHLYGLRGRELRRQADRQLDRFGLGERMSDKVKTLSGGLRRRVELAKALLHRPRLLLLDEPSSALDPGARRDLWSILEVLRAENDVTVLLTTHYIEEGDRCDRLALIDRGKIVAAGTPEQLKAEIGGDVVTVAAGDPEGLARDLRDRFDVDATVHGDRLRFEHGAAPEFVGRLAQAFPGRMQAVTVSKPTLEDVFLRHAGRGLWEADA